MTDAMIIDTHAHYDSASFADDREEVLNSLNTNGVELAVNVGSDIRSLSWVCRLCDKYENVYGAIGIHPDETKRLNDDIFNRMEKLCSHNKIVAVGEIGLDYYWNSTPKEIQKKWFIRQMELAKKKKLPVIIHSREAAKDVYDILTDMNGSEYGCVIHCFSSGAELAEEYVKRGYYIGVGGVVTFKNGKKLKEVVSKVPLEKILLETDCPYLSPEPFRGKRNDSSRIIYMVHEIARIKQISNEEVLHVTNKNAKMFYNIG